MTSPAAPSPSRTPWWASLALWRGLAFAGFALAFALGVTVFAPRAERPDERIVAVLAAQDGRPALLASADRSGRYMTVKAIGEMAVPAGRELVLWVMPEGRDPLPLGPVPASGVGRVPLGAPAGILFQRIPALGVTVEAAGTSPPGKPSGPALYRGAVQLLY
jgi:anti-sigma-K factor RskA